MYFKPFIIMLPVVILVIILMNWIVIPSIENEVKKNHPYPPVSFERFDTTEISGHLLHIDPLATIPYFCIREDSNTYYQAFLDELNVTHQRMFKHVANIGDSIIKAKNSDTLTLFSVSGNHYYMIRKDATKRLLNGYASRGQPDY